MPLGFVLQVQKNKPLLKPVCPVCRGTLKIYHSSSCSLHPIPLVSLATSFLSKPKVDTDHESRWICSQCKRSLLPRDSEWSLMIHLFVSFPFLDNACYKVSVSGKSVSQLYGLECSKFNYLLQQTENMTQSRKNNTMEERLTLLENMMDEYFTGRVFFFPKLKEYGSGNAADSKLIFASSVSLLAQHRCSLPFCSWLEWITYKQLYSQRDTPTLKKKSQENPIQWLHNLLLKQDNSSSITNIGQAFERRNGLHSGLEIEECSLQEWKSTQFQKVDEYETYLSHWDEQELVKLMEKLESTNIGPTKENDHNIAQLLEGLTLKDFSFENNDL